MARDSHSSLRPLRTASAGLGMTPKPCAARRRLIVRHVSPMLIRVAADRRLITQLTLGQIRATQVLPLQGWATQASPLQKETLVASTETQGRANPSSTLIAAHLRRAAHLYGGDLSHTCPGPEAGRASARSAAS